MSLPVREDIASPRKPMQAYSGSVEETTSSAVHAVTPLHEVPRRGDNAPSAAQGYTMVPNFVVDELLAELPAAEFQVLIYLIRRTVGFQRVSDAISISQFLKGNGKDGGCGVKNRQTLLRALSGLEARGLITSQRQSNATQGNMPTVYTVLLRSTPSNILKPRGAQVARPDPSNILKPSPNGVTGSPPSHISEPRGMTHFETKALVSKHDPQKKALEKKTLNNNRIDDPEASQPRVVASSKSFESTSAEPETNTEKAELLERLVAAEVTRGTAQALLAEYPADLIRRQLDALPFRRATEPAAVLVRSIQQDWASPKKYAIQARKREQAAETVRHAKERDVKEAARQENEDKVSAYLASLPDDERSAIEEEASARMLKECGKSFERASTAVGSMIHKSYVAEIITEKIQTESPCPQH